MEGPQIDPLEKKVMYLPWFQNRILKNAKKLKDDCFERVLNDRRVEIGLAGAIIKNAISVEFGIDIDDIRINGRNGDFFKSEINGGALNGGFTDIEYSTGIQNVLLVFRCCNREELENHNPSSTALVIKGKSGIL